MVQTLDHCKPLVSTEFASSAPSKTENTPPKKKIKHIRHFKPSLQFTWESDKSRIPAGTSTERCVEA